MKRILIVEGQRNVAGGQRITLKLCKALESSYDVSIFLPKGNNELSLYLNEYSQNKFTLFDFSFGKKKIVDYLKFLLNFIYIPIELFKTVRENNIQLIYIQSQKMIPYCVVVASILKIPVIAHLHVYHIDAKARKILNFFLKFKCIRKIVGVSNYALSQLSDGNKKKAKVIYNYVDFKANNHKKIDILHEYNLAVIADVIRQKGHNVLIEALDKIKDLDLGAYIIGEEKDLEYSNELRNLLRNLELTNKVTFTGKVEGIGDILNKMDLVIVPSIEGFETFSLSMVEAWLKGVPTIASDLGGMKELVDSFLNKYKDNLLFKTNDSEDLSKKIQNILKDEELYKELSSSIRETAYINFSRERFELIINNLIKEV